MSEIAVIGVGDSRANGAETNQQTYVGGGHTSRKWESGAWVDNVDTAGAGTGTIWPLLATQLMASRALNSSFLNAGTSSSDIIISDGPSGWDVDAAFPNGTRWEAMLAAATASGLASWNCVCGLFAPNCILTSTTTNAAAITDAFNRFAAAVTAEVAGSPRVFLNLDGYVGGGSVAVENAYRAGLQALADAHTIAIGANMIDLDYAIHFTTNALACVVANRFWMAIESDLYSAAWPARGPQPVSASLNSAKTIATINYNQSFGQATNTTLDAAPWVVKDGGTPVSLSGSTIKIASAAAVTIALASPIVGACTISFGLGDTARAAVVPHGVIVTLPVSGQAGGDTVYQPGEPFTDLSAPVSTPGTVSHRNM